MVAFGALEGTFRNKSLVWLGLALSLVIGVTIHGSLMGWAAPIYAAEFATFLAIAIALLKPKSVTTFIAFVTSFFWLTNQLSDFMASWGMLDITMALQIWAFTAVINTFLLAASLVYSFKSKAPTIGGGGTSGKMFLTWSMVMMFIYALLKTYLDFQIYAESPATWALSGGLWALGILLVTVGTFMSIHIKEPARQKWSLTTMITMIGFTIALFAALYYGLALTVYTVL